VKHNVMLTIASLLSILFMTFHLTDDIVRGMEPGGVSNMVGVLILVVWLYGTMVLAERRSGYVINPPRVGRSRRPHERGGSRRRDRQVQRRILLRLDTHRARRYRDLLRYPLCARTVEPATGPAPCARAARRMKYATQENGARWE
jgi:hypothetical protein